MHRQNVTAPCVILKQERKKGHKKTEMDKVSRVLMMHFRLSEGEKIYKKPFCTEMEIGPRTFERDIEDIRLFLNECYLGNELLYDREEDAYRLKPFYRQKSLSAMEISFLLEMLNSCRVLRKDEYQGLVSNLLGTSEPGRREYLEKLVNFYGKKYERQEKDNLLMKMQWDLQQCIAERDKIRILLKNKREQPVSPVGLQIYKEEMYLFAYDEKENLEVFQVKEIRSFRLENKKFEETLMEDFELLEWKEMKARLERKNDEKN